MRHPEPKPHFSQLVLTAIIVVVVTTVAEAVIHRTGLPVHCCQHIPQRGAAKQKGNLELSQVMLRVSPKEAIDDALLDWPCTAFLFLPRPAPTPTMEQL